ncbi:hypothetical protein C5N14_14645 [Micromonospora sp. MW-13]|uniref:nucleotidyltransferase domain-containing protein n=1 Tax=unclassified Micromonospora TaxID=2617518 RepID=UPI000E4432B1|nr:MULTISPECIES: nucleotidyltransferase domain-containing protein [unclassified Micromonospora]MCX4474612.1 nucleotidyltransferase domain-containing protein [Micromonospora sp. NBC_01655]RGC68154.1 hypothetical protein C5N14_14645 [Micromonospora sp. MW-13]
MSYREEKLAKAMSTAQEVAQETHVDSVYLAGSLTAGLGSPTSDVDVFVLSSGAVDDGAARQRRVGDVRVDIEDYSISWVDGALRKLAGWDSSRQRLRHGALSDGELDFLIRMRDIEVVKTSPELERLLGALAAAEDRLRQMALSTWALRANGDLSDLRGAWQDGDHASAGLVGQSVMVCAGKAVSTASGDLYLGSKWVHRQLRRSLGDAFPWDQFLDWQCGAWARPGSDAAFRDFVAFQQTLMAAAQLLGWNSPAVAEWPFWELGKGPYRRNPHYNTIHLTEGVLLNNELQRQVVVKPDVALVWALSNGRDEDEIVDAAVHLSARVSTAAEEPLGAQRARDLLALLHQRGLVSRDLFR